MGEYWRIGQAAPGRQYGTLNPIGNLICFVRCYESPNRIYLVGGWRLIEQERKEMDNSDADNAGSTNGAEAAPATSPNAQANTVASPSDELAATSGHVALDHDDAIGWSVDLLASTSDAMDQLADNDMLAAVVPVSADVLANLEHTFDHLVSSTDLFDVPAIDFDGANSDVG